MSHYKPDPSYKDSGVEWLGEVPEGWEVLPCRRIVCELTVKNEGAHCENYLSLMANVGVIPYAEKGDVGNKKPEDLSKCKIVSRGNFVINSMNYGIGSYGVSEYDGVCSPVYIVLSPLVDVVEPRFAFRIFETRAFQKYAQSFGTGILEHRCAINWDILKVIGVAIPSKNEQIAILNVLDRETTRIDTLVQKKTRFIELLKEKRQAVITHAVTKGLDPNVKMKDSGVEWLGEVPEGWEVARSKFLFTQRKEYAQDDDVQLSATQAYGVIPQAVYEERIGRKVVKINTNLEKRKHVEINDFVISMRSFQGGLERAWATGCIRSSYVVIYPLKTINTPYFSYLFKSSSYIQALQVTASFIRDGQDLNFENFSKVDLPFLSLQEQQEIANHIDREITRIDTLIHKTQRSIELLRERRSALITAAVTGRIDVRGEVSAPAIKAVVA